MSRYKGCESKKTLKLIWFKAALFLQAQCEGREGRQLSYGRKRRKRQLDSNDKNIEDFNLKEMFRVYDNREEITQGFKDFIKLIS